MQHKIGIYVRVSTEEQAQVADGSIESQQHRINAFIDIKKHQEKNWGKVFDTYIDDGYSAGSTNRPAYQRMIRDLKDGKITLILITDLSRLSRNIADFCDLYKEFGKYKANFLSIKEQFDTSTPIGEMMVFNMVNLAQFERKQTSERISMNFHSRAMRGLVNGGNPLLGYDRDPDNAGKRIINEPEASLVKQIFELYNEGQSQSSIADQLTNECAKRKDWGSRKYRHIQDGRWTMSAIQNILKNYAYIGKREVNVRNKQETQSYLKAWQQYQLVPAAWQAIVDEKTFQRVQERLKIAHSVERKRFDNSERRAFLVSGKLRCGHCDMALIGQSAHGKTQVHRYYGHKQLVGEKITCPVKRYPAQEVEEAILHYLDKVLSEPGHLNLIENNIEKSLGADRSATKLKKEALNKAIEKVENEIDSIFKIVINMKAGTAGTELIQEKLQKLAEKKKSLEQEATLVNQTQQKSNIVSGSKQFIETNLKAVKASLKKAKPHLQKKLIGSLFQQLVATDAGIKIFYNLSENMNLSGNGKKMKKPSEVISDGLNFLIGQTLGFFESQSSPIHCDGGGGGNRTRVRKTFQ
jgi:site-specific DNA recombinase